MNHSFHHHSSPFDHHQSLSSHVHPTSWICQGPSHQLVDLGRCLGMVWSESPCSSSMETGGPLPVPRPATRNRRESNGGEREWTCESEATFPHKLDRRISSWGFSGDSTATAISLHQVVVVSYIYIYLLYIYICVWLCVCVHHPLKEHLSYTHAYIHIIYIYEYIIIYIYNVY